MGSVTVSMHGLSSMAVSEAEAQISESVPEELVDAARLLILRIRIYSSLLRLEVPEHHFY